MTDLSVIIVSFNTKDLLLECINSIFKSNPIVNFDVIVVDNNSTDGSVDAVKKLGSKVKLIENKENKGFAAANNQGIKIARGEYILLLNSDTTVKKGSIDELIRFAKSADDAGVVVPRLLNSDGSIQGSVMKAPGILAAIKQYWFGEEGYAKHSPEVSEATEVEAAVMAAYLITPKGRAKVPKLDERYFMYYEDLEYSKKIRSHGLKIYFLPTSEILHHHGASGSKLAENNDQWRRLIPSSKIYHGQLGHFLVTNIIRVSQKLKEFLLPLLFIVLILPTIIQLFQPGYFAMQDDLQAFRVYEMDRCFDDLQIPCRWVPDAGYQFGYPQFNFYPPTPYYVGAILHRAGIQYIDTVKILFIFGYIASGLAMYWLVKMLLGKWEGFIAALLYTYIPYKAVEVYVRGALSEFWAQIFFPLILLFSYQLIKSGKLKYLIATSISLALLATTHTLMTMIFAPVIAVWCLFWFVKEKKNLPKLILSAVLGFGLSAFFLLPVLMERQFAHLESLLGGYFDYRAHFVSIQKLFLSMEWGYGSSGFPNEKLNLSLGIPHLIAGLLIAPFLSLRVFKKDNKVFTLFGLLGLLELGVLFMIHMKSSFIWALFPSLWFLQFPWRFLAPAIFLISLLIAFSVKFSGKYKYLFGVVLVALSFILYIGFFVPKTWYDISDAEKFSGNLWEKQLTISIFDYLPIYAEFPPINKAPTTPEILDGEANFVAYTKGSDHQEGKVVVTEASTIRLPLFDFPGMVVRQNGEVIPHRHDDCRDEEFCYGLITIDAPVGVHAITVELTDTPVRTAGNMITLASLAVTSLLIVQSKRHAKASD